MSKCENSFEITLKRKYLVIYYLLTLGFAILLGLNYHFFIDGVEIANFPENLSDLIPVFFSLIGCGASFSIAVPGVIFALLLKDFKVLKITEKGFDVRFIGFVDWSDVEKIEMKQTHFPYTHVFVKVKKNFDMPKLNLSEAFLYRMLKPVELVEPDMIRIAFFATGEKAGKVYKLMCNGLNKSFNNVINMSEYRKK